ncbi:MAG TPA: protein-L-isoaspartate(D-aspartate) O-methyltransferase [Vicinamibacteria bacterium]
MSFRARALAVTVISVSSTSASDEAILARARERMVAEQIAARDVKDPLVLGAMRRVPRHLFVPEASRAEAYDDHPLPIGHAQTISQPYIVAFMTAALGLRGGESVLEIGTGSGYQAAVLSEIVGQVHTIEIVAPLAEEARARLLRLGYRNVQVRAGDGYRGWPEVAPFDAIMVTAAAPRIPEDLKRQLKDGGRLIVPVGDDSQELVLVTRRGARFDERRVLPVRFVPMTGEVRKD